MSKTRTVTPPSSPSRSKVKVSSPSRRSSSPSAPESPSKRKKKVNTPSTPTTPKSKTKSVLEDKKLTPKKAFGRDEREASGSNLFNSARTSQIADDVKETIVNLTDLSLVQPSTKAAYKIINQFSGQIGGNGSGGPIYGELTVGSMQRVTEIMKRHLNLNSSSRFVDVGAGLGKPNVHVGCDPGVEFSYGIEVEKIRWQLSLANLRGILKSQMTANPEVYDKKGNTILTCGNIFSAQSFDPFTHVYQFDVGFPDNLCRHLSKIFNVSKTANYLISYHLSPRLIEKYGFDVEYICQITTSMHGSGEGHTAYFYKRTGVDDKGNRTTKPTKRNILEEATNKVPCDPLFAPSWDLARGPETIEKLSEWVDEQLEEFETAERPKRGKHPVKKYGA